jgi:hypothetical protein
MDDIDSLSMMNGWRRIWRKLEFGIGREIRRKVGQSGRRAWWISSELDGSQDHRHLGDPAETPTSTQSR